MKTRASKAPVAVIGELNVDIVASGLSRAPELGAEIIAADLEVTLGSASAIFASGVSKLGHPVNFISKVGADDYGRFCLDALRALGVSTRHVRTDAAAKTGVTLALSTRSDRALVTYLGTISTLRAAEIDLTELADCRHLHMTSYFLQTALKPDFARLFGEARRRGLTTSFDPNSDPEQAWTDEIRAVFKETDILFLNSAEALQLTRAPDVGEALRILHREVPCAVVKLGARGAVAIENAEVTESAGFRVAALDTTGAGDSFAAAFVSATLEGRSMAERLRRANAFGALSTLKAGGTASQPDERALEKFIDQAGGAPSGETSHKIS